MSVKGATGNQLTTLYSNMYRLYMYPNLYSENAGTAAKEKWVYSSPYEGTDDKPVIKTGKLYANNGFWDTYRTTWPAYSLLSTSKKKLN
ncbi:Putative alpha-1,2-mannosidase [Listeria grayi]|uniref:Alpha-1,2-mannosidase n=1 Tax=Listeria grayi TaxID=1641 RepID=A0A378MI15_LISGR|nr:glycoside hydrolase domain-containing protein [Listeria grayi]STY45032.1 Putative alpha-1,2-mannosidase [Listeria grayi]